MRVKCNNPIRLQIIAIRDILFQEESEALSVGILVFTPPHPYPRPEFRKEERVHLQGGEL